METRNSITPHPYKEWQVKINSSFSLPSPLWLAKARHIQKIQKPNVVTNKYPLVPQEPCTCEINPLRGDPDYSVEDSELLPSKDYVHLGGWEYWRKNFTGISSNYIHSTLKQAKPKKDIWNLALWMMHCPQLHPQKGTQPPHGHGGRKFVP